MRGSIASYSRVLSFSLLLKTVYVYSQTYRKFTVSLLIEDAQMWFESRNRSQSGWLCKRDTRRSGRISRPISWNSRFLKCELWKLLVLLGPWKFPVICKGFPPFFWPVFVCEIQMYLSSFQKNADQFILQHWHLRKLCYSIACMLLVTTSSVTFLY